MFNGFNIRSALLLGAGGIIATLSLDKQLFLKPLACST